MDIKVIHSYFRLMDEGLAPIIFCGNDKQHTRPLIRYTDDERIEFFCLACDWKMEPGTAMYESMQRIVDMNWNLIDD